MLYYTILYDTILDYTTLYYNMLVSYNMGLGGDELARVGQRQVRERPEVRAGHHEVLGSRVFHYVMACAAIITLLLLF